MKLGYLFFSLQDLLNEVDVGSIHIWQEGLTILLEEMVDLLLSSKLLFHFANVDFLETLNILHC